jgi:hypothetical protein
MSGTRGLGYPQIGVDVGQQAWVVLHGLDALLLPLLISGGKPLF